MRKILNTTVSLFQINFSLFILRLGIGALMLTHGWPKLIRLLEGGEIRFPDPIGLGPVVSLVMAVITEVLGSVLIMAGLFTRLAAFSLAFTMAVAVFIVHADDPFSRMELGLLYLLVYIILMITGGGAWSMDKFFRRK